MSPKADRYRLGAAPPAVQPECRRIVDARCHDPPRRGPPFRGAEAERGRRVRYDLHFTLADPDFYAPVAAADAGPRYAPAGLPEDWTHSARDVWASWTP